MKHEKSSNATWENTNYNIPITYEKKSQNASSQKSNVEHVGLPEQRI